MRHLARGLGRFRFFFGWQRWIVVPLLWPFASRAYRMLYAWANRSTDGTQLPGPLADLPPRLKRKHAKALLTATPFDLVQGALKVAARAGSESPKQRREIS